MEKTFGHEAQHFRQHLLQLMTTEGTTRPLRSTQRGSAAPAEPSQTAETLVRDDGLPTLQESVPLDVSGATATAVRPDDSATGLPANSGVNVYLYQVTPNTAWRNADLPTRDSRGNVTQRPRIALDLHYLFTFYGSEATLEAQRVLGSVVRTLHARPYLTRETIRATVVDPSYLYLAATAETPASNLAEEIELVKLTPIPLTLEELSKLWSVLLQTTHTLCMAYLGTVVLVEAEETPRRALPVRERGITVFPFQRAVIERVLSVDGVGEPVVMGGTILIEGSQLAGSIDKVRVGVADLQPVSGSVLPSQLEVELADPALRAGVQGVQVVYENGSESNVAALVLRPTITVGAVTAAAVTITFDPAVDRAQRVVLTLNEPSPPTDREPHAYSFEAPADNGITDPLIDETTQITFAISGVEPDTYLVRVQVNGAENVLEVDTTEPPGPTFGFYIGPTAVVP